MYEAVRDQILNESPARLDNSELATTIAFRAIAPQLDALTSAERLVLTEWLDRAIAAL